MQIGYASSVFGDPGGCNYADRAPGVNDDSTQLLRNSAIWIDTTHGDVYMCLDGSTAQAAWAKIGSVGHQIIPKIVVPTT